ncbi:MAG: class I SAM-dependent methyltransferase [Acidobacteriota bacterium]
MRDRFFEVTSEEFVLNYCPSCGLLFQDENGMGDPPEEWYPSGYWWKKSGRLSQLERLYRIWMLRLDQLRWVKSCFPEPDGRRLLDIGCAGGGFVQQARAAGFDAFGLESSAEAVGLAQEESPGRIIRGDVRDLIERGEQYDILTLFHVLEHVPEPFRFLKELRRLLKRPGAIFVQVPNAASLQAQVFGSNWYGFDCPRHLYNYSSYAVLYLMGRAGYRIDRVRHFSLRDNAAALVSSLFPSLDPMSQRVRFLRKKGREPQLARLWRSALYFNLVLLAQPVAFLEAKLGRGATVTICGGIDD